MRVAFIVLMLTAPAIAQDKPASEAQVRRDCMFDAVRYCKSAIVKGERMTIINCMLENRDKLQAKCSRHLR